MSVSYCFSGGDSKITRDCQEGGVFEGPRRGIRRESYPLPNPERTFSAPRMEFSDHKALRNRSESRRFGMNSHQMCSELSETCDSLLVDET